MNDALFAQISTITSSLVLLMGIAILWRHSLQAYIDSFARQSLFFVFGILTVAYFTYDLELCFVALIVFLMKVIFIPRVLHRARRYVGAGLEIQPFVNTPISLMIAGLLTLLAYAIAQPIVELSDLPTRGGIPIGLAVVFVGLFIIVSRKSALTQIVGFLVMENGIALLAVLATYGVPLIVELGVFLDVLLGFLVMQVFLYRIRETFSTIDIDQLQRLKH
jgi:hydrogenase-4 component E